MFSISEFLGQISKEGLAMSNLFALRITKIPPVLADQIPTNELVFFCKSVELPPMTLSTETIYNQGFGPMERRPVNLELPLLPTTFFVDSNHKVLKFFHAWMQAIINYDVDSGVLSEVDGRLPYEIEYRDNYVGEIEVLFYSTDFEEKFYTVKMHNVHPVEVGQLSLSWEANDEIAVLPVSFSYDTLKVDGSRSGVVVTRENRGPGFFDYLYGLQTAVSQIRGINRPDSVQDAINQYTTINNVINNLF